MISVADRVYYARVVKHRLRRAELRVLIDEAPSAIVRGELETELAATIIAHSIARADLMDRIGMPR